MHTQRTTILDWTRFLRPVSASVTITGATTGSIIANHHNPPLMIGIALFSLAYHLFGFAHNNLCDLPYDKQDKNKTGMPLVTSRINPTKAKWIIRYAIGFTYWTGILLLPNSNPHFLYGLLFLTLALITGFAYNWNSKQKWWASIYMATSAASIPAYAYFANSGNPTQPAIWYVTAYAFFFTFHWNAIMGSLKDAATDTGTWMPKLGVKAKLIHTTPTIYDYEIPIPAAAFAWFTRTLCPILTLWYLWPKITPLTILLILAYLGTFAIFMPKRKWVRSTGLNTYLVGDVCIAALFFISLSPILGMWIWWLLAFPPIWSYFWNRILWGPNHLTTPNM